MIIRNDIDRDEIIEELEDLDLSKPWRVDVVPFKINRSNAQNSLLHVWLKVIDDFSGQGVEDLKVDFAIKFLGYTEREQDGKMYLIPKSTSSLNVKEFTDFLNNIERYARDTFSVEGEKPFQLPNSDDLFHEAMGR